GRHIVTRCCHHINVGKVFDAHRDITESTFLWQSHRECSSLTVRKIGSQFQMNRPEIAACYSSISSSTRALSCGAVFSMSSPSALAVLRLKTSLNLVGCWTGRSPGFSPLRTRPAYWPMRL